MTIICYKDGIMAADGAISADGLIVGDMAKIIRAPGGGLAAGTGRLAVCYDFGRWVAEGNDFKQFDPRCDADSFMGCFVGADGIVWRLPHDGRAYPVKAPFFAMGSSEDVAFGALAAGASAEEAVQICAKYCAAIGGTIQVERLG